MIRRCALGAVMAILLVGAASADSPDPYAGETPEQRNARMAWWTGARFGLFIHWGVYAVPAGTHRGQRVPQIGEWIMHVARIPCAEYRAYAKDFNPIRYDPDAWVRLVKEAGMRYIVITAKHHDGFALYDSAVTDWDVVDATPYKKDLLAPLAAACRRHGIKLGFYYSQAQDWNHRGGAGNDWDPVHAGSMDDYLRDIAAPQVREILTKYGADVPAVLWWDTSLNMTPERARPLIELLRLKPGIIHNNRLGGGFWGDFNTPEQSIPGGADAAANKWETCMTMNDTWGYKSYDQNWKSAHTLIRNLADIASKGGNYLLNVGPTAEGEIPAPSVERLREIGTWMKVNGEAIHGTSAGPFQNLAWGRCTRRTRRGGETLYLLVFDWPTDGRLVVPAMPGLVTSARLLAGGPAPTVAADGQRTLLTLLGPAPDAAVSVIAIEVDKK